MTNDSDVDLLGKIVVHGGAGFWKKQIRRGLAGVRVAASQGIEILRQGGTAVDAAEAAIVVMEDNPVFNAGKGSSLTLAGTIEMDAAIMDGQDLSAGAVALVRRVKNPIRLARIVMEKTDHVLLAGKPAERLAKTFGLSEIDPMTVYRRRLLAKVKKGDMDERVHWARKNAQLLVSHPELATSDTVGAVAIDSDGNFAAAASTGGPTMKLAGRIGDTPLIGSGLYADNRAGAATVTGLGEIAIKLALSKTICSAMERRIPAQTAATAAVRSASNLLNGEAGVIAIDKRGRIASAQNTPCMPWAMANTKSRKMTVRPHGEIVAAIRKTA